jgi:hypothetical protein
MEVNANPEEYSHPIINTGGYTRFAMKSRSTGHWLIFEQELVIWNNDVPYRTYKVTALPGKLEKCPIKMTVMASNPDQWFYKTPEVVVQPRVYADVTPAIDLTLDFINHCRKLFVEQYRNRSEHLEFSEKFKTVTLLRWKTSWMGCKYPKPSITSKIEDVVRLLNRVNGVTATTNSMAQWKKAEKELVDEIVDPKSAQYIENPLLQFKKIQELKDAFVIADVISSRMALEVADHKNTSRSVSDLRSAMTGTVHNFVSSWNWRKIFATVGYLTLLIFLITLYSIITTIFRKMFVTAFTVPAAVVDGVDTISILVLLMLIKKVFPVKKMLLDAMPSLCVRDRDRCCPVKMRGIHDPKIKVRSTFLERVENFINTECNAAARPGAHRIFAELRASQNWRSCVIHSCDRTMIAAALRACSNKVTADPIVMAHFSEWFRNVIIPELLAGIPPNTHIDIETWLSAYPQKYQEEMRRVMKDPNWIFLQTHLYESFPKVEKMPLTVPVEEHDTPLNVAKERQISGPSATKKLLVNPIIAALEKIADKALKGYCGGKDWPTLAKEVQDMFFNIAGCVFGAADGSGFDMTQLVQQNQLMNEAILAFLKHPNVTLHEPLNIDDVVRILNESLILRVNVGRGAFSYEALGRASGDGWTTFGNTLLMLSYWRYTFHLAGILDYGLLVKGDDVLFCVPLKNKSALLKIVNDNFCMKQEMIQKGLGQICKFIKFGAIEEMDFLSCHFFWTSDGSVRMTRIPERVFQSISWSTKINDNASPACQFKQAQELCFSSGMCLLAWSRGLSIFETLGKKMVELGVDGKLSEYNRYVDKARCWDNKDDSKAYDLYLLEHYGLTTEAIRRIEAKISGISSIMDVVHIPELDCIYAAAAA